MAALLPDLAKTKPKWPESNVELKFYAVAGERAVKSVVLTELVGISTEFTVEPRWMKDGKPVLHVEVDDFVSPGKKLHLEPLFARASNPKNTNLWAVMVPVTNLRQHCHVTVGLHRTKAEAEAQLQRLRALE